MVEPLEPIEEAPAAAARSARLAGIALAVVVAVALLALILLQSGDDRADKGERQRTAQSGDVTSTVPGGGTPTTTANSTPTTPPGGPGAGAGSTTTTPTIPASPDDYTYRVTLSAPCAHPGDSFTVVMYLQPDDVASMLVRYADNQSHDTTKAGVAGPDGRFEYTFTVGPTLGKATVVTSASRRTDGKSGTTSMTFDVTGPTTPC